MSRFVKILLHDDDNDDDDDDTTVNVITAICYDFTVTHAYIRKHTQLRLRGSRKSRLATSHIHACNTTLLHDYNEYKITRTHSAQHVCHIVLFCTLP